MNQTLKNGGLLPVIIHFNVDPKIDKFLKFVFNSKTIKL